jgi:BNR repeat-like domain
MRARLALIALMLVVVAAPSGVMAGSGSGSRPYSSGWLAANHTKYDNQLTALYERSIGYGRNLAGGAFLPPRGGLPAITNVRMSTPQFSGDQDEFQVDINPLDHRLAIGASNDLIRQSGTGYYRTSDGGKTWFAADLPLGTSSCCDPGIAYADDGSAYFINLDTSPAAFYVMRTTDNGVTWTKAGKISPGDDRENIVVDNSPSSPHHGRIYVTYTDFGTTGPTNEIKLYYSDDHAATWTGPVNVSHTNSVGNAYPQSSQPRVAPDGTVYVGFQWYPAGTYASARDMMAKSTDGGVTFAPAATISAGPHLQGGLELEGDQRGYFAIDAFCSTFRHRSFPIMGVDPANSNTVYAMWAGGNLEQPYNCDGFNGFHSDVLFSRSTDGGATWSAPLKVNDDPPGKDQYYPWMDVAPNGTIWIGWHDRRNDPQNIKHVWYMDRSIDGGLTFGTDVRVGSFQSQPSDFIGDYAGLAAENDLVLPMWWDSRNTVNGDPYTAPIRLRILP